MTTQVFVPQHPYAPLGEAADVLKVRVGRWERRRRRARDGEDLAGAPWLNEVAEGFSSIMARGAQDGFYVSPNAVISSLQLLSRVMASDTVVPTVVPRYNGGVQLEWHILGIDLEVAIDPDGRQSAWCEVSDGREWEDDVGNLNIARLRKELSPLVRND